MTAALMRGADLIGHPVVAASTGDDLAEVKDVMFNPAKGVVTGFTLRKRGFLGRRMKLVLPVGAIVAVGTGAVLVEDAGALTDPDDAPEDVAPDHHSDVLSDHVITESGRSLGTVRDVVILGGANPRVVAFEVGGGSVGDGLVPIGAGSALSGSALIVPDSYEQRIRTDLTGLAA
ncbi:MAG: PRC-barrel domain containing protein, partial [Acidimicrobiia bacterium]|nr:PRC-barrel domain containing protein [Acidimicrobiia bacterium]